MAGIGKCMGIMTAAGFALGAGATYYAKSKQGKALMQNIEATAKNGKIPIGGMTEDGKMWDGEVTVDEAKKNLNKATKIMSLITGAATAIGIALITGATLLLRGKVR